MKKTVLAAALAAMFGMGAANAGTDAQIESIIGQLKAQGYSHIKVDAGDVLLIVEARRGLFLRHFLVNRTTGKVFGDKTVLSFATAPAAGPEDESEVSDIRRGNSRVIAISSGQTATDPGANGGTDGAEEPKAANEGACYLSGEEDCEPDSATDPESYQDWKEAAEARKEQAGSQDEGACYLSGEDDCEPDSATDPESYQDWKEAAEARKEQAGSQDEGACYLSGEEDCEPDSTTDPESYQDWKEAAEEREQAAREQEQTWTDEDEAEAQTPPDGQNGASRGGM